MKKFFTTLCLLIGFNLATQAQVDVIPTTISYSTDVPDYINKDAIFDMTDFNNDDKNEAYFDRLYIMTGWSEYKRFFHSNIDQYEVEDNESALCTPKKVSTVYTNPTTGTTYTSTEKDSYVGKYPAYSKNHEYWGKRGDVRDYNNLNMYNTSDDGFIRTNLRYELTTLYYGWHKIRRVATYTYKYQRQAKVSRTFKLFVGYTYSIEYSEPEYLDPEISTTYFYESTTGTTTPTYAEDFKPTDELTTKLSETDWQEKVKEETWSPTIEANADGYTLANEGYPQTKTFEATYIDYIYVWAPLITEGDNTHLGEYTANDEITFDESTGSINGQSSNQISETKDGPVTDIVAQVRHHFRLVSQNSYDLSTNPASYNLVNYYDTTWYTIDPIYNPSENRYSTGTGKQEDWIYTNDASDTRLTSTYHEFDINYYNGTPGGTITKLTNAENRSHYYETETSGTLRNRTLWYTKTDENTYTLTENFDATKKNAGPIVKEDIYITGTCESLHWQTQKQSNKDNTYNDRIMGCGWMQPVNCHIYLDNARLRAASISSTINTYLHINDTYDNIIDGGLQRSVGLNQSASVFFLPEDENNEKNTTTIHLKGNNYLGGNLAQKFNLQIMVKKVEINLILATTTMDLGAGYSLPKYCAPIEIKDAMFFANTPAPITCKIDAQWADGNITNGYLDVSTRPSTYADVQYNENTEAAEPRHEYPLLYHNGTRYEAPLVTGGNHGQFVIDGGHINLWPANALIRDIKKEKTIASLATLTAQLGALANYMVCGRSMWELAINSNDYKVSAESNIVASAAEALVSVYLKNVTGKTNMYVYGAGNGVPEGKLVINGGTITANTDTKSFGYTAWYGNNTSGTNTSIPNYTPNAVNLEGVIKQHLIGPNIEINGGTFLIPLYGTEKNNIAKANGTTLNTKWPQCIPDYDAEDFKAKNAKGDPVSRAAYALPKKDTDYTAFKINTTTEPEAHNPLAEEGKIVVIGNVGTAQEYLYGLTNVWSDEKALGYFYLPSGNNVFMQNYYVQSGETVSTFDLTQSSITTPYQPYHLWIDKGGEISVAEDYTVYGRPYYRSGFTEGHYHLISMPFTVDQLSVLDPDASPAYTEVPFTGWVESRDNKGADNSEAYCYLYHLDDGTGAQKTTGVNDTFRENYHTHTDGSTMLQGKTYAIKFLESGGYWTKNPTIFRGAKGQTINGKNTFDNFAKRPTNDLEFVMDGNATFASQDISGQGEIYLLDKQDTFIATPISDIGALNPMQGYLLGNEETMKIYRRIGREGKVEQTALDQLIHTGWTAVGAHQAMLIITPQDATAHIYTAEGKLWKTISLTANTGVVVSAPAGFYIVQAGNDSKKVLVH